MSWPTGSAETVITGRWYARHWTCHAATTVLVDDPAVLLGRRVIAECEDEQTARLVAEAPALLAALQALLHEFGRTFLPGSSDSVDAGRAVLGRVGIECPVPQVRRGSPSRAGMT